MAASKPEKLEAPTEQLSEQLIPVQVADRKQLTTLMCARCRRPPTPKEIENHKCRFCKHDLHSHYHRAWTTRNVVVLIVIGVICMVIALLITWGIYMLGSKSVRQEPLFTKNTTGPCQMFKVDDWSAWGKCDKLCGNGTKKRTVKLYARGTCPPTTETMSCFVKPCCSDGWKSPNESLAKHFCYEEHNEEKTFDQALKICQDKGGTMALEENKEQGEYLSSLVKHKSAWIGLSVKFEKKDVFSVYVTLTGYGHRENKSIIYGPFAKGEPFMKKPENGWQRNVFRLKGTKIKWGVTEGETEIKKPFICENMTPQEEN